MIETEPTLAPLIYRAPAAVAAALGLICGSFANVCIHRIPEGGSVVTPRSRCPRCTAPIRWYDNIPILSWLWLRARCRACRAPIGWIYPLVEGVMGLGFVAVYLKFGLSIDALAAAFLLFVCVVLTVIDARLFLLPDLLTLTGIAAGLGFALARGLIARAGGEASWIGGFLDERVLPLASLGGAAAGAAVPLVARGGYILVRRLRGAGNGGTQASTPEAEGGPGIESAAPGPKASAAGDEEDDVYQAAASEGMGLGDVKMLAMVGAFLGPRMTLVTILLGSIGGCVTVLPWLFLSRRSFRTPVPFGPFIAAGAILAAFAGEDLSAWYSDFVVHLLF